MIVSIFKDSFKEKPFSSKYLKAVRTSEGSDMRIESELGKGTTVTLSLLRYSDVNKYSDDELDLRIPSHLIN